MPQWTPEMTGLVAGEQPPAPTWTDKLAQTWPARMAKQLMSAAALPGDVYQGNVSMYGDDGRTNLEVIGQAADLAGLAMTGTGFSAPAGALGAGPVRRFGLSNQSGKSVDEMMAERQSILQNAETVRQAEIAADIKAGRIRPGSTESFSEKQAVMRAAREAEDLAADDAASMLNAGSLPPARRLQSSVMDAYAKRGTTMEDEIVNPHAVDEMRALLRQHAAAPSPPVKAMTDQEKLENLRRLLQQSGDF